MPPMLLHDDDLDTVADPTPINLLAAATRLAAAADARTAELDAGRQVPDDLHRAAARAGLFRQLVAPALGGRGAPPLEWFRIGMAMARHEPSFAWVVTQGAAELGWIAAGADETWAMEVLADPLGTSASSSAGIGSLTVDGATSRFRGRWAFNSGSPAATWIGGLAMVDGAVDDGRPVLRWGWVPAERAEVLDDWDTTGLRGTGSHSTVIAEQEIPTEWTFSPFDRTTNDRGPHRVLVGNGDWPIAASVAAVQLGNARRALDEATPIVLTKAPSPDFVPLSQNAAVLRALTEAEGLWAAAVASMERELAAMWDEAEHVGELSDDQRVRLHRAAMTANDLAVRVVDLACEITGTTSMSRGHVLSRCHRDAHALRGHIATNGTAAEHNARVALGLAPDHILV